MEAALRRTKCRFLVVSFSSDWLYTAGQAREMVNALETIGREVEYHHVEASFGHDSFLVEVETMTHLVGGYVDRLWETLQRETNLP
jgi:homoserine O-acetyltransferase